MKTLLFFIFLFLSSILSSQTWTNYNLKDLNLYTEQLYDLDIDSEQNIWFASLSGLLKYDGTNWTVYDTLNSDLPENQLYSVEVDNEDNIWIGYGSDGPSRGLAIFDGQDWIEYNEKNSKFDAYTIRDIIFDKNNTPWFATGDYIWTHQNNDWIQYKHIQSNDYTEVSEIEIDKNNNICFLSSRKGVFIYSDGLFRSYSKVNPFYYNGLAVDSNNNIWVVNNQNSLMYLNTMLKEWIVRDTTETPISAGFNIPHTIIVDRYNTLWIAERRNLHNFNPETDIWKSYTAPESLFEPNTGTGFTDFKLDKSNNFWFITSSSGVFKLSDLITDVEVEPNINGISIYPNPASSLLSYETNNITSIIQQSIVDLSGKEVINDKIANAMRNSIDVSKLQIGIYFLQLTDTKGVKYSKKFVVE